MPVGRGADGQIPGAGSAAPGASAPGGAARIPARLPSGNDPFLLDEARRLGWSWAAFLMPYPWLLGHGRLAWGMILILSTGIPVVGLLHLLLYPLAAVWLGRRGHELAWTYAPYHSLEQLREGEREWVLWGVVFKILLLLALAGSVLYVVWMFRQPELRELYREMMS